MSMTENYEQPATDYARIERAIHFLEQNFRDQPDLKQIAASVGLSEYHFQRLFTRWAGVSPKRFVQFLAVTYAKELLAESKSLLETTYETGLSSPGRLHDLFVTCEAVTPGEYKKKGAGLRIAYGFQPTPFGEALLAVTGRGLCGLSFVSNENRLKALADLQHEWPQADFYEDPARTQPVGARFFTPLGGSEKSGPLPLYLKGTNFQLKVWQALLNIPPGRLVSYQTVAGWIDQPQAAQAVGQAVSRNPIAFLIPCHRVIRRAGNAGGYRWGATRKKAMLGWEAARRSEPVGTEPH